MTRTITSHEATVKTAVVEIKTMAVSGKQMTLSVFRQLPDKQLIDPMTGTFRGEPWGKVNYFWNGCHINKHGSGVTPHLHIVWSDGLQLFRCGVFPAIYQFGVAEEAKAEYEISFRMLSAADQLFIAV